jgi:teichuronic acid biosynthesis glycosyltransferase TuaG
MAPRVSVIIPAHNASASLGEALDSVISQTYGDWEAIVADDCSDDGTSELAAEYRPRVRCVRSERNLGPAGARNLALAEASGELVALLDADDMWMAEYLQIQVARYDEAVAAGQRVGLVCCDALLLHPSGRRELASTTKSPITLSSLLHRNTIFVGALVPRALIDALGGFAADCLGTEDYDMWLRILETGRAAVVVNEPLAIYRVGHATVSSNVAGMARATQTAYRHALERGRLDGRQRALVRRELRLQRLIELRAQIAQQRQSTGRLPLSEIALATPLGARVALEHPRLFWYGPRLLAEWLRRVWVNRVVRSAAS